MVKATSPAKSYTSSSSFISGDFAIVDLANDMVKTLVEDLASHIHSAEKQAQAILREKASHSRSWQLLSDNLEVSISQGSMSLLVVGDEVIDYAKALEYGTPDAAPEALLRSSVNDLTYAVTNFINSELRKDVPIV